MPPARAPNDADLAAVVVVHGAYNARVRVTAEPDRTLTLSTFDGTQWNVDTSGLKLRTDGTYSTDQEPLISYRALAGAGRSYLVKSAAYGYGHYRLEFSYVQRIDAATEGPAWLLGFGKASSTITVSVT